MLTSQQIAHFCTFGFLLLPQVLDAEEMAVVIREAESLWAEDPTPVKNRERRISRVLRWNQNQGM